MWVTPEQIEQAKQMDLLTYLRSYEPNNLKKISIRDNGLSPESLAKADKLQEKQNELAQKRNELDKKYPMYGYKNHKGYPTKKHIEAINKYGLIEGYRKT